MADLWVRPELKESNDLITPAAFGHAHGMETTAMASRLRRYADKAPQVVRMAHRFGFTGRDRRVRASRTLPIEHMFVFPLVRRR